jgi:hypothetical protein
MDRWADRFFAIASSGADGVYNMEAFTSRPHALSQLLSYFMFMEPNPNREKIIFSLALMLASNNKAAAAKIRRAWNLFSEAMGYFPVVPAYVSTPAYAGPSHPLILDRGLRLNDKFYTIEVTLDNYTDSHRPSTPLFVEEWDNGRYQLRDWDECDRLCRLAREEIETARDMLGKERSTLFLIEWTTLKHLCLTVRTCRNTAHFYLCRDRINDIANNRPLGYKDELEILFRELLMIAGDELDCACSDEECLILNPWNDFRHQSDGPAYYRVLDILREKIVHTKWLINERLPEYKKQLGI